MTIADANQISDRIVAAVHNDDDIEDILDALVVVFTFFVSTLDCPHCRKQAIRALKLSLAGMLTRANAAAARRVAPGERAQTCH